MRCDATVAKFRRPGAEACEVTRQGPRESLGSHSKATARLQPSRRLLLLDFTARLITGVDKKVTGLLSRALAMEGKLARPLDERCQV